MVVQAQRAVSIARNGVGAFIHQCKQLDFHYCDWAGSSRGMNAFLQSHLAPLAARSPQITHHISPRPNRHPVIRAHYVNGARKAVCVRNMSPDQILSKAVLLRDSSGEKNRRLQAGKFVRSVNESVRGVWSGLHSAVSEAEAGRGVWDLKGRGGKKLAMRRAPEGLGVLDGGRDMAVPKTEARDIT